MKVKVFLVFIGLLSVLDMSYSQALTPEQLRERRQEAEAERKRLIEERKIVPSDFPYNYIVDEWWPSAFKGSYVFYKNGDFLFIHGGIGKSERYDFGKWVLSDTIIKIDFNLRLGLRPIGEPINPEVFQAANPDDYLEYEGYQNYEEWIEESLEINTQDFLWEDCYINKSKKASDISIDTNEYLISGDYKVASCRLLSDKDLKSLSKKELRLMRNEIFARYGYKFKSEDLKQHFSSKGWYTPQRSNADEFITDIERKNIALIKKYELK